MRSSDEVLQTPLQYLKGVGPRKAADFRRAGLYTLEDLLYRFPLRYEDRSQLQTIASLKPGQVSAVAGEVLNASLQTTRRPGFRLFSALVQDASGQITAVWPNQAFLKDVIKGHAHIVLYGKVEYWGSRGMQITDPEFEIIRDDSGADDLDPQAGAIGNRVAIYADVDGDTYGAGATTGSECDPDANESTNNTDCNDSASGGAAVNPGATAFGAAGLGLLGEVGREAYLRWQEATEARVREARAHADRVRELAELGGHATVGFRETQQTAERGHRELGGADGPGVA
jgi:hypothetical protein